MPSLYDDAAKFGIDANKPYFPVNSLRLLYYQLADAQAPNHPELIPKISEAIPLVEAIFSARTEFRSKNQGKSSPLAERKAAEPAIQQLLAIVPSPAVQETVDELFTTLYPIQDDILAVLFEDFSKDGPLNSSHLRLLLRTRALDSIVFSRVLGECVRAATEMQPEALREFQVELDANLHVIYQLNDLVDAVVYAKDDIQSNNFSPLQLVRKIAPQPQDTKALIVEAIEALENAVSKGSSQAEICVNFVKSLSHVTMS